MSDPGLTSEQRAAIAVHNATQNRMCLNLSGNGQICVACSEVADQIDAAVEVERQRSQAALAAARRECEASKADLTTLLGFIRYIICPVCAADHVRIENGIIRGHPPLDRRAAGEGNRCTASRGSLVDVARDATARATIVVPQWSAKPRDDPNAHNEVFQQIKAALDAPAAGEEGKR